MTITPEEKTMTQEMKLNHYPTIDNAGFLKSFLRYLEELLKSPQISILENEINMLISLLKVTIQDKLHQGLSTRIIDLAYQAEYVIDLYLVTSGTRDDTSLFDALSNIVEQMKPMVKDMHGLSGEELPAPDVARASSPQVLTMALVQVNDKDAVVGIQEDVNIIKEYLLSGEDVLDAISIVGMAGIGKTTMALTIYNSSSVDQHFDIKVWCTISQCYQMRDLLRKIIGQMNIDNNGDDQELADCLNRSLRQKRYLFILDDVWDTSLWDNLKWYLPNDRQGSRILITTRDRSVAPKTNNSKLHELGGLTQDESWELFQKKLPQGEVLPADLLSIAKGMVVQCKGLPLSIVIVAGLLSDVERSKKKWNEIATSVTSSVLNDPQGKCKAILELSYIHLPDHLKSCFLYLGAFPEDHEISFTHLMRLWIAEGFVQDTESKNMEEVAEKYMEDLIGRSLVTCASERPEGGVKTCRLHDLLHDFCVDKADEEHFLSVLTKRYNSQPLRDPRRLSINNHMLQFHNLHFSCHGVRSIFYFTHLVSSEIDKRIESFDMPLLKVLEIRSLSALSTSNMSKLIHLRYLAIWKIMHWQNSVLLSDITKLRNLETLILLSIKEMVVEVPDSIWDLVKLRHVSIRRYSSFHIDSKRLEKSSVLLENLKSLSKPRLTSGDSIWLSKLPGLQKLSCVFWHSRDHSLNHCGFPVLQDNDQLLSLKVRNGLYKFHRCKSCKLHFPASLRKVTLLNFGFLSKDISDIGRALPGLEILKLYNSRLGRDMGSRMANGTWIVNEPDFPKLKVLKLRKLGFSHWIVDSEYSFPCLEQLWIKDCKYLYKIPLVFGYVANLSRIVVRGCKPSVDDSAIEIEEIQRDEQNTELKVSIIPDSAVRGPGYPRPASGTRFEM